MYVLLVIFAYPQPHAASHPLLLRSPQEANATLEAHLAEAREARAAGLTPSASIASALALASMKRSASAAATSAANGGGGPGIARLPSSKGGGGGEGSLVPGAGLGEGPATCCGAVVEAVTGGAQYVTPWWWSLKVLLQVG